MALQPWPTVPGDQHWAIEQLEELLAETTDTPQELSARARELREEAGATEIKGYRDAASAPAERFEAAAASRLAESRP